MHQVGHRPEQKHDAPGTEQGRHDVHHVCHLGRVGGKLGEEVGRKHEEGCAWRMAYLQFIGRNDELGAVPQACRRLCRKTIDRGGNGKRHPPHDAVYKIESELLHDCTDLVSPAKI